MENFPTGNKAPTVTVIMPAYNAQAYIAETIDSVLRQTVADWELLVLDYCSADDTCAIVESFARQDNRITLIRNERNLGVARTRNHGLEQSRGSYVAFLDSDDVWRPNKLEKQIARLEQTSGALCYSSYAIIRQDGRRDYAVPESISYEDILKENVIGCSTVVITAEIAKKYCFRPDFFHEDYAFWLQILKDGYLAVGCTEILADWRYVENSRSFNKWKSAQNRWSIYRKFLKLPFVKSLGLISAYTLAGLKKYGKGR